MAYRLVGRQEHERRWRNVPAKGAPLWAQEPAKDTAGWPWTGEKPEECRVLRTEPRKSSKEEEGGVNSAKYRRRARSLETETSLSFMPATCTTDARMSRGFTLNGKIYRRFKKSGKKEGGVSGGAAFT